MCGIAGIIANRDADRQALGAAVAKMVDALVHRGPDDQGAEAITEDGRIWLANTRLAILDPSQAGHQPMQDPRTGNWIVLNGEIYNHLEIRSQLDHPWRSGSDTETVLAAYTRWGPGCLEHLRGMFAFAIFDAEQHRLWCARDRLGIKPFYYYRDENAFLFASEVRALLASDMVPARIDRRGVGGYLRYGSVPEPLTLIQHVVSLPAGQWLELNSDGFLVRKTYWRPEETIAQISGRAEQSVEAALRQSVREHLLSDVPVASFLSGGIDSSLVTALASAESDRPLRTFTLGFRGSPLDESAEAEAIARKQATDHQLILLEPETVTQQVTDAVVAMDLPTIDGLNTYLVSRAVAQTGVKVVLSGLGGDELFGGYPSFWDLPWAHRRAPLLGLLPQWLRKLLAGGGYRGARAAEMTRRGIRYRDRYHSLRALWPQAELARAGHGTDVPLGEDFRDAASFTTRSSLLELTGYMRSVLLRDADAMSMANGLELRVPFLDHELVGLCLACDTAAGSTRREPKPLLSAAAMQLLEIPRAPRKRPFSLPMGEWMRGPLSNFVDQGLRALAGNCPVVHPPAAPDMVTWQLAVLGHWVARHTPTES